MISVLKTSAFKLFVMNKVYWRFGDIIKSSSFPTINILDISNTNMEKLRITQHEIVKVSP